VTPKGQQGADGQQLWDRAQAALAAGDGRGAETLFRQSLAQDAAITKWRSAALALAGAHHLDLAADLLAGHSEPALLALSQAIAAYRQAPPPGFADAPLVVGAMGDALMVAAAAAPAVELDHRVSMTARDLAAAMRYWQAWVYCRQAETGDEPDGRSMLLWRLPQAPAKPPPNYILQVNRGQSKADSAPQGQVRVSYEVLLHESSAPLGLTDSDRLADEDSALAAVTGPAQVCLGVWSAEGPAAVLVLEGTVQEDSFIIQAASDAAAFRKLQEAMADPALVAGQSIAAAGSREADAVVALAEQLGFGSGRLVRQGRLLAPALRDPQPDDDDTDTGQWLCDLVSYIRYGRQAVAGG
jgi:hypothetical protein